MSSLELRIKVRPPAGTSERIHISEIEHLVKRQKIPETGKTMSFYHDGQSVSLLVREVNQRCVPPMVHVEATQAQMAMLIQHFDWKRTHC